ncbi:MAG: DUF3575 domain-containing protein [Prevotellaceae bacterium]|jgi:hypothetical protein|nr:DUF3575 domain-containing protein [Prevotellaceae bacterium]
MKKCIFILLAIFTINFVFAQEQPEDVKQNASSDLQRFAIKTNFLYDMTGTVNLGVEFGLSYNLSLDVSGNINQWKYSTDSQLKHILIQPELRYWLKERFNGHFFGVHLHYANFNIGGIEVGLFHLKGIRYDGNLFGGGLSYGYRMVVSKNVHIEATAGLGYANLAYNVYYKKTGIKSGPGYESRNWFGPTKIGLNFIYVFNHK